MDSNEEYGLKLLERLSYVNWNTTARTYGNNNASLIGLIAEWWNSMSENHWTMDEAPGCYDKQNSKQKQTRCDLILFNDTEPVIAVEVEGTSPLEKLKTLEGYLKPTRKGLDPSRIAMLFLFDSSGSQRKSHDDKAVIMGIQELTRTYPERMAMFIRLYKCRESKGEIHPVRVGTKYNDSVYNLKQTKVSGALYHNGVEVSSSVFWPES